MIMMEDHYQNNGVTFAFSIIILVLVGGGNSLAKWVQRSEGNSIPQDDNNSRMEGPYQKDGVTCRFAVISLVIVGGGDGLLLPLHRFRITHTLKKP